MNMHSELNWINVQAKGSIDLKYVFRAFKGNTWIHMFSLAGVISLRIDWSCKGFSHPGGCWFYGEVPDGVHEGFLPASVSAVG